VTRPEVLRRLAEVLVAIADEAAAEPVATPAPASADVRSLIGWVPVKKCGISETTARAAVKSGEIASSRVGRDLLVKIDDVRAYIEARRIDRDRGASADGSTVDRAIEARRLRLLGGGHR